MDNLAHTLAGAALGEAGLKRRTPLAVPTLLIAANLPDVDVAVLFFGNGLAFRRGWTHGILAIVVFPFLLTAAMVLWDRHVRRARDPRAEPALPRQLFFLSCIGVLSHPFLDWLNNYGLRWLMPFDGTWFYGDALFIVDPWLWMILLLGVILARDRWGPRAGRVAVSLATLYIGVMLIGTGVGTYIVRDAMAEAGVPVDEVMIGPVPVNANRRDVVMRRGETYYRGTLRWLPAPRLVVRDDPVPSNRLHPAAVQVTRLPQVREFLVWSRFPFYRVEPLGQGFRVVVDDFRYSDGSRPSWAAVEILLRDTPSRGAFTAAPGPEPTEPDPAADDANPRNVARPGEGRDETGIAPAT